MLLALSTGQKLGLALVAGLFILFSLASSLLFPRTNAAFPGRRGLPLFIVVTVALFIAMVGAIEVLAREGEEVEREASPRAGITSSEDENEDARTGENAPATTSAGNPTKTITVSGDEFNFRLSNTNIGPGTYRIVLRNTGQVDHNLVISGPEVDNVSTPVIGPGERSTLTVALVSGTYKFYCSVEGHEDAGMTVDVDVA